MTTDPLVVPEDLSDLGQVVWRALVPSRVNSPERLALLQTGLRAFDRAEAARRIVDADGPSVVTKTTGMRHQHPLIKVQINSMTAFMAAWRALGLTETAEGVSPRADREITDADLEAWKKSGLLL